MRWRWRRGAGREAVPVPEWASFFEADDFAAFLDAVDRYFERRGQAWRRDDQAVLVAGSNQRLGLHGLAQKCHAVPRAVWQEMVAGHFSSLLDRDEEAEERLLADFERVRPLLKVRLYHQSILGLDDGRPPSVLVKPIPPELLAVLACDLPTTVQTVPLERAAAWGVGEDELFRVGFANVRAQDLPEVSTRRLDPHGVELTLLTGESFFIATSALWLDDLIDVPRQTGALVGIPSRDVVIVHAIRDGRVLHAVQLMLASLDTMFREGPGSLSPSLYWWRLGTLTRLEGGVEDDVVRFAPPDDFTRMLERLPDVAPPA
jgi:hypothetical protein